MAGRILILLVLSLLASPPDSIPYVGPEEVVLFSQGSDEYQVGLVLGDKPQGPARLLAVNSKLYLLDRLNSRVLCFDTSGSFLYEIKLDYKPLDMAVDGSDRVYVLDTSSTSIHLESFRKGDTGSMVEINYYTERRYNEQHRYPVSGVVIYPGNVLYIESEPLLMKPLPQRDILGFLNCSPNPKRFYLDREGSLIKDDVSVQWDGLDCCGSSLCTEIYRLGSRAMSFLPDKDSTRIIYGAIIARTEKRGTSIKTTVDRRISVEVNKKTFALVCELPKEYFSIDNKWRNASVDYSGNVYMFVAFLDGKAAILRWRPSL
jgi:hypothetical protein